MGLSDRDYYRDHHKQQREAHTAGRRWRPGSQGRQLTGWGVWIFWFSVFVLGAIGISQMLQSRQAARFSRPVPASPAFPPTGQVHWYIGQPSGPTAPLTVEAPAGVGFNFVARLDAWETRQPVAMIPLVAGEIAEVAMPLGRYRLTVIKGSGWQGPGRLFKITTSSREAVHPVEFYRVGNQLQGRRILLEAPNGNMEMAPALR